MIEKRQLYDVQLLRVLSTIGVVLFHAFVMPIGDGKLSDSVRDAYNSIYDIPIRCWLINIAMPCFMSISGFLFMKQMDSGRYPSILSLLKRKLARILLPYMFFSALIMVTMRGFNYRELFAGTYWHLWFLPTLMWCFICGYLLYKPMKSKMMYSAIIVVMSLLLPFCPLSLPSIMGLGALDEWICFFLIGGGICLYNSNLWRMFAKVHACVWLLVVGGLLALLFPVRYSEVTVPLRIQQVAILISLWYIVQNVNLEWMKKSRLLQLIDNYSFGIYIFHAWFCWFLLPRIASHITAIPVFASSHLFLYPLSYFLIVMILSVLATWGAKQTYVGRYLL